MTHCKILYLVTLLTLCFTSATVAQKAPITFGKIDEKDLKMTVYPKDSSASAVILCDYGEAEEENRIGDWVIVYEYHRRVKILKTDADVLEFFGNITIPYYKGDIVSDIKAVSYELQNGVVKETKLDKSGIFTKEIYKNYFTKTLALPNIKNGVVIEYTYSVVSSYTSRPETWYFQHPYPTIWSEYRFAGIGNYRLNQEGFNPLTINKQLNARTKQWAMQDVPALRSEPFITTPRDYYDKIEFQYAIRAEDEWKTFVKVEMEDGIGNEIKKNEGAGNLAATLTAGLPKKMDKIAAIVNYLKTNIALQSGFFFRFRP